MISRITPHLIDLVYEAALKSFWRKEALKRFLRSCKVSESIISSWGNEERKREFLDRFFDSLRSSSSQDESIVRLAKSLIEQKTFPDLDGWEDSKDKIADAVRAVENLRTYINEQEQELKSKQEQADARKKFQEFQGKIRKSQQDLENLSDKLNLLVGEIGTQEGGYKFQEWFYDLMDYFDVTSRRPYNTEGRQIDGSITIKDTTYLIELKFTASQIGAGDIDSFIRKVTTKADNTMGIFLSISGYSSTAITEASKDKTPILLLEHSHIYMVLGARMSFQDMIDRIKRNAHQTGQAFLEVNSF